MNRTVLFTSSLQLFEDLGHPAFVDALEVVEVPLLAVMSRLL